MDKILNRQLVFPNNIGRPTNFNAQKFLKLKLRLPYIPTWYYILTILILIQDITELWNWSDDQDLRENLFYGSRFPPLYIYWN